MNLDIDGGTAKAEADAVISALVPVSLRVGCVRSDQGMPSQTGHKRLREALQIRCKTRHHSRVSHFAQPSLLQLISRETNRERI